MAKETVLFKISRGSMPPYALSSSLAPSALVGQTDDRLRSEKFLSPYAYVMRKCEKLRMADFKGIEIDNPNTGNTQMYSWN